MGLLIKSRLSVLVIAVTSVYLAMPSGKEPDCVLDNTIDMNIEENIRHFGYPFERHVVETEDGFYLHLVRIARNDSKNLPVLVIHGFSTSSRIWVAMGPNQSLAYQLFDAGYDVWLADLRGNEYSLDHKTYKKSDPRFWDFSIHEMGRYDLPALIDHILAATGKPKLVHIGYSMGSGALLVMSAMHPHYTSKVEGHIAMAPSGYYAHSSSAYWTLHRTLVFLNKIVGDYGSAGGYNHGSMQKAVKTVGTYNNFLIKPLVRIIVERVVGTSESLKNTSIFDNVIKLGLVGSSVKTAEHFLQLHKSGKFQQFDYGSDQANMQRYSQRNPPLYNLPVSTPPIYVFHGATDTVCSPQDVVDLQAAVNSVVDTTLVNEQFFNHVDFFIGPKTVKSLNPLVVEKVNLINENYRKNHVDNVERVVSPMPEAAPTFDSRSNRKELESNEKFSNNSTTQARGKSKKVTESSDETQKLKE